MQHTATGARVVRQRSAATVPSGGAGRRCWRVAADHGVALQVLPPSSPSTSRHPRRRFAGVSARSRGRAAPRPGARSRARGSSRAGRETAEAGTLPCLRPDITAKQPPVRAPRRIRETRWSTDRSWPSAGRAIARVEQRGRGSRPRRAPERSTSRNHHARPPPRAHEWFSHERACRLPEQLHEEQRGVTGLQIMSCPLRGESARAPERRQRAHVQLMAGAASGSPAL